LRLASKPSDAFSVEEAPDSEVEFDDHASVALGNTGEITVNMDNYGDSVFVRIGDESEYNYQELVEVGMVTTTTK